jgi:hypothetical protein
LKPQKVQGKYNIPDWMREPFRRNRGHRISTFMSLWKQLYAMVWLAFFQILIAVLPTYPIDIFDAHVLLGLIILVLAHYDNVVIRRTHAPDRVKRIVRTTAILATVQPILGVILYLNLLLGIIITPLVHVTLFLHIVNALAIITQAASAATGYDMWEEHELGSTTRTRWKRVKRGDVFYCVNCGAELPARSKFCNKCGEPAIS